MSIVTILTLACQITNGMLFCAEPKDTRVELNIRKDRVESLQTQTFYFVKDIDMNTVVSVIYGNTAKTEKKGCKFTTVNGKDYYYEFSCAELKKVLK